LPSFPNVDQASKSSSGSNICEINEAIPAKTNKSFRKARNNDIISGILAVSYTVTYILTVMFALKNMSDEVFGKRNRIVPLQQKQSWLEMLNVTEFPIVFSYKETPAK